MSRGMFRRPKVDTESELEEIVRGSLEKVGCLSIAFQGEDCPLCEVCSGAKKEAEQKHLKDAIDVFLWCLELQNSLCYKGPLIFDHVAPSQARHQFSEKR